ncbi:hypothetical protein CBL_00412 [Carabus blaptoides fortunei]
MVTELSYATGLITNPSIRRICLPDSRVRFTETTYRQVIAVATRRSSALRWTDKRRAATSIIVHVISVEQNDQHEKSETIQTNTQSCLHDSSNSSQTKRQINH